MVGAALNVDLSTGITKMFNFNYYFMIVCFLGQPE
jgi:hypothetical protein